MHTFSYKQQQQQQRRIKLRKMAAHYLPKENPKASHCETKREKIAEK